MTVSSYIAPYWLPGGHLQTLFPYFFAPRHVIGWRRERWELDDGDFIDADWLDGPSDSPLVVAFHGLEGNSDGYYMRTLAHWLGQAKVRMVAINFRGCSGEPNRLARAYFAGDSTEIGRVMARLDMRHEAALYAVGYSLGANALLRWLGEQGNAATPMLRAAIAVSAPLDLPAAGHALDHGINRWLYTRHFLHSLRRKAAGLLQRHPGAFDGNAVRHATTLHAFDQHFTAVLHGYRSADDYWKRAASLPLLDRIAVPTLLINARNDPFLPGDTLPRADQVSAAVQLEFPAEGGHVGFPGSDWLSRRMLQHLDIPFPPS